MICKFLNLRVLTDFSESDHNRYDFHSVPVAEANAEQDEHYVPEISDPHEED